MTRDRVGGHKAEQGPSGGCKGTGVGVRRDRGQEGTWGGSRGEQDKE